MRSRRVQDALRLWHAESGQMVRNWPTGRTPLHYVTAMDFSPQSGYLTVGNDKGRVLLLPPQALHRHVAPPNTLTLYTQGG